jgi:hypothetical protein
MTKRSRGAPRSLLAKFSALYPGIRAAVHSMGFYEREIGFYREFAADCPVRKPRCCFGEVEMDSGASLLLLEDRHHPGKGHLSRQHCEGSRLKADSS